MYITRHKLLAPLIALTLTVGAIVGVSVLVQRSSSSRVAQLDTSSLTLSVAALRSAPLDPNITAPGAAVAVEASIRADEDSILRGLTASSQAGVPVRLLATGRADLAALEPVEASVIAVFRRGVAAAVLHPKVITALQLRLYDRASAVTGVLAQIGRTDAAIAARARVEAVVGAAGAMLLLFSAFAFFYLRSVAMGLAKGVEARTDALTGLGNRRALSSDLAGATVPAVGSHEWLLVMFDLDGFKQYNDSFGHAAGDALLHRLGSRLAEAAAAHGYCLSDGRRRVLHADADNPGKRRAAH